MNISERRVRAGRLELNVAEVGEGPPILILHGFPEYWAGFRGQMQALAAAGFRAIAPDLPGYGKSDKFAHTLDYESSLLAGDLAALIPALGLERAHVIGHDWGGTLAYCLASRHPEVVDRLLVMNAGHPELFRLALRHFEQIRKSWYMFMFQLPFLPEWLVRRRFALSIALRGLAVNPHAFSDADLDDYLRAMRLDGVAHAAVSYYRAAFRAPVRAVQRIDHQTRVLWGQRDKALSEPLLLNGLEAHVPNVSITRFADAGHWLHHDQPEPVSRAIVEFFSG
ncbi:MAG TPA: alpha/beta hydrolase [Polyangiaceae bacterium]|jgi:pimeloyl-ACP methyl ester carboxylesterase